MTSNPPSSSAAAPAPDCTICLERCNKSTKKPACCPYCAAAVCRGCIQTYLVQDQAATSRCPSCAAVWNEEFLTANLTGVFRHGPLKAHLVKVNYDLERARLPEFQERARAYTNAKEMKAAIYPGLLKARGELYRLQRKHAELTKKHRDAEERDGLLKKVQEAQTDMNAASIEIQNLHRELTPITHVLASYGRTRVVGAAEPMAAPAARVWRSKCPDGTCLGFLCEDYKCGLCDLQACKECLEPTSAEHVCNPDTLQSVRAIQREAKPCPKCAAMISKIDGCDQMWCTQCKTAFSWITGNIETTIVHNPHYYQWMRETGQVIPRRDAVGPAGGPCALTAIEAWFTANGHHKEELFGKIRTTAHIDAAHLQKATRSVRRVGDPERVAERCVMRLVNQIADEQWKSMIDKNAKEHAINVASVQFHQMCVQIQTAILGQVLELPAGDKAVQKKRIAEITAEFKKFELYRAETSRRLRLTYKAPSGEFYGEQYLTTA